MLGPSKEAPNQILGKSTNEVALRNLLKNTDQKTYPFVFGKVDAYVGYVARVNISSIMSALNLDNLSWIIRHDKSLPPILLLGKNIKDWKRINDNYEDAITTIEIASKLELDKNGNKILVPTGLSIASVCNEKETIIASKWDLENQGQLAELNISISDDERLEIGKVLDFRSENFNTRIVPIPTSDINPYQTAGLITPAMCEEGKKAVLENYSYSESHSAYPFHNHVLVLKFKQTNPNTEGGCQFDLDDTTAFFLKKCGYYYKISDGIFTIGLGDKEANWKDLKSWEINAPLSLKKA